MWQRSVAPALFLLVTIAAGGEPCEGLLDRAPHDPHSSECLRGKPGLERIESRLAEEPDDPWLLAALGANLLESDARRARPALAAALGEFVSRSEAAGEAYVRLLLARDFQRRRLLDDLHRELDAAEPLVRAAGDPVLVAWLVLVESNELSLAGRYEESVFTARQATLDESFAALPRFLRYAILSRLGESERHAERFSEALAFVRLAAAACGDTPGCRSDTAYGVAMITHRMAQKHLVTRAEAEKRAGEAYEAALALGNVWAEVNTLCILAQWSVPPESIERDRLCEERAQATGCIELRFLARLRQAANAAAADPAAVERSIRLVEQVAVEQRRSVPFGEPDLADTLHVLAQLHEQAGNHAEAIAALEDAIDFRETARDRLSDSAARASVLARSAPSYYELAAYLALAEQRSDLPRAFATMEALRARTLLDQRGAPPGVPAPGGPDGDDLARAVEHIATTQTRLADPALSESDRDAALLELERLELREADLASRVARANPAWAELRRPHLAELDDVRRALRDDEALILLQLPPPDVSASWALIVEDSGERVVRLAPFDIGSTLSLYLGAIERRVEPPAQMARAIEEALLSPVIEALAPQVRSLVIVPDGPLARLPLAALPDPRSGRPLVEGFELSLAPSATAWVAVRGSGMDLLEPAALGLGDVRRERRPIVDSVERSSSFALDSFDLPRSRPEVRSMVEAVGGGSRALLAARASEAALKRLDLRSFGIVHFATHAIVNSRHPSRSAILLAAGDAREDGLLQPREIANLGLAGQLVVLSACRSADGRELRGEGALSLAREFIGAGARAVLGTIWRVRDAEAAALVERFYSHLARGQTAAASLAAAQRELLAAGAPPAAWAGFVLIGDGGAKLPPRPSRRDGFLSRSVLAGLLGLAALTALSVWWRRRS